MPPKKHKVGMGCGASAPAAVAPTPPPPMAPPPLSPDEKYIQGLRDQLIKLAKMAERLQAEVSEANAAQTKAKCVSRREASLL